VFTDIEEIKILLNNQIEELSSQISTGMCEDFNQYKHLTGMIEGLTRAVHVVNDYNASIMEDLEKDSE
tara:strand:- start:2477 stop:2680 length:204 start_codon:yes stop_codon:yes gene_type:complete